MEKKDMNFKMKYYYPLLFIFFLGACTKYELTPISNWKQLNDFPGEARASATSFVYNDMAFICLGRSGSKVDFLKDLWQYDSQADRWTRKTDFPGAARVKAIGAAIGDKAYVGLGAVAIYEGNQFSDFWEYDMTNDIWKQVASFPGKAKNDLFCAVIDDCIYTTEGYTESQFNSDTYKYNPKTNEWTKLTNCPVKRTGVAGFAIGKNLYVGTGYDIERYKDFYCYHTETDTWSRVADLPKVRVLSKGVSINGQGYIMVGRYWNGSLNGGKLLSDVVKYDPMVNKWTRCGDFPGGGRQNIVAFAINGKGYIVGGEDDWERKSDVWVFQP
jgi:N-acetylneuraminic acid mutarotase